MSEPKGGGPLGAGRAEDTAGAVGDLPTGLLREWGPVLKPVGLGLLTALHSLEERTPGHPFVGWAHCTQAALAAYLDTSPDTIARYTGLLVGCGLVRVDEVDTQRGKQKLYRVARGAVLPSLGLLEYLLFDADQWTRKHTAWLVDGFAPLAGSETELARLLAALGRAYTVGRDAKGLAQITAGGRLTAPGSFLTRRAAAAQAAMPVERDAPPRPHDAAQPVPASPAPPQLAPEPIPTYPHDAVVSTPHVLAYPPDAVLVGVGAGAAVVHSELGGQAMPHGAGWGGGEAATFSAQGGVVHYDSASVPHGAESLPPSLRPLSASSGAGLSAPGGVGGMDQGGPGTHRVELSAPGGVGAGAGNVNVIDRFVTNVSPYGNDNVNVAPGEAGPQLAAPVLPADAEGDGWDDAPPGTESEAGLLAWAVARLDDAHSVEWHRQMLARVGAARYRTALAATRRAQAAGKVGKPRAYFTAILKRMRPLAEPDDGAGVGEGTADAEVSGSLDAPPLAAPSPVAPLPLPDAPEPDGDLWRVWQAAGAVLRPLVGHEAMQRTVRYAVLLELDAAAGWAVLGVPNSNMRQALEGLAGQVAMALAQVTGTGPWRVGVTTGERLTVNG